MSRVKDAAGTEDAGSGSDPVLNGKVRGALKGGKEAAPRPGRRSRTSRFAPWPSTGAGSATLVEATRATILTLERTGPARGEGGEAPERRVA